MSRGVFPQMIFELICWHPGGHRGVDTIRVSHEVVEIGGKDERARWEVREVFGCQGVELRVDILWDGGGVDSIQVP